MRLTSPLLALVALGLPAHALAEGSEGSGGSRILLAQESRHPAHRGAPAPAPPPPPAAPVPERVAPQPPVRAVPRTSIGTAPAPARAGASPRHPTAPAPPPGSYYGPGYYPGYPYYVSPWSYSAYLDAPWWWGWGWGWGWYPVYPAPPPPGPGQAQVANRISTEVILAGGPTDERISTDPALPLGSGSSLGLSVRVEGRELGFHASYDGFYTSGNTSFGSSSALDSYTAHATWSFLSGRSGRLRLEGGLAALSWASLPPYGPVTVVEPEVGLSGQFALVGPLGLVGYGRTALGSHQSTDFQLAAALRLGPVALTGGWRDLRADGGSSAPDLRFAGPQFGLALLF